MALAAHARRMEIKMELLDNLVNARSADEVVLECKNLSLGYGSKVVADNINFSINNGSYLCIVGENGAGKSTLMKTILGLQKPLSGTINFGKDFDLHKIGYLPQQTEVQRNFPATVEEIVLSGCQNRLSPIFPFYRKEHKTRARDAMDLFEIRDFASRGYKELSGGQQQRVLLARALCAADNMLLLDEPVTGLDPIVTEDLYGLIKKLNDGGITIIMITHDIQTALSYSSCVLYIGKEHFFGTKEEFRGSGFNIGGSDDRNVRNSF